MIKVARPWRLRVLGLVTLVALSGCAVTGEGYIGAVYEPPGYDYDGWQAGYYVAPPRGGGRAGEHRDEQRGARGDERHTQPQPAPRPAPSRAYRPAPPSRPAPSIPTRPAPPAHERNRH